MDWREHISIHPNVCHGHPIASSVVLDNLAAGSSATQLLKSYPSFTSEAVQAAAVYGAELVRLCS